MKKVYLISISGGKDSQATWNYMKNKYKHKGLLIPYFCDTGWESEETYKHLKYLEKKLGKLYRIKSDKYSGFEDMCIKRKGFPSRIRRFCTEELKIIPSTKFIRRWKRKGYKVVNVVGVRASESKSQKLKTPKIKNGVKWWIAPKRDVENIYKTSFLGIMPKARIKKDGTFSIPKKAKYFYSQQNSVTTYQPIVHWNTREVMEYNILNNTKNNPLYAQGYSRVGCLPCINANKLERGLLSDKVVNKVTDLEKAVQATTQKTKPVFFHKGGILHDFAYYHKKDKYNTLGFELGCINQLGFCE